MPNHHRGEIEGILNGTPYRLCLTLGALADLEAAFGDDNMLALAQRFEGGKLAARDCVRIIGAGLRGAGHPITDDAVARMQADGGIAGFVDIVARLLTTTFGGASQSRSVDRPDATADSNTRPPPPHAAASRGVQHDSVPCGDTPLPPPPPSAGQWPSGGSAVGLGGGSEFATEQPKTAALPRREVPAPDPFPGTR